MKKLLPLLSMTTLCCIHVSHADERGEGSGTLGTGYSFSSGKYGTATTTSIESLPIVGSFAYAAFSIEATVPLLKIKGDPDVLPDIGRVTNLNPQKRGGGAPTGTASGVGDASVAVNYDFLMADDGNYALSLEGGTKLRTGQAAKGLGTGAMNYSLGLSGFKSFGPFSVLAGIEYVKPGSSRYIALRKHVTGYSLGTVYEFSDATSIGADYDATGQWTLPSGTGAAVRNATVFLSRRFADIWSAKLHFMKGLADGSPESGGGLTLSVSL